MSSIDLVNLTKKFGDFTAVEDLSLDMPAQSFVALLGPSGCGKTTTMNMISGIQAPDSGTVRFDGQVMNSVPARRRNVGFVFQNYAIFTHLTVYQNLSFGLEIRRVAKPEIERRVREIAALLGLEPVLSEPARRLGVNALQRLAIGRSAITNPQIFRSAISTPGSVP
jgi:multiple sugar transport system ATP-binding protein